MDLLGVGEVGVDLVFLVGQRGGHDGTPELPDDVGDDGLVGDADADGLLLALEDARDVVVGLQDELLISWLQSPSAVILEPRKIKSDTVSTVSPSISHEVMGPDAMIFIF